MSTLQSLQQKIAGEILTDELHLRIYATDASVYREMPQAVIYPKTTQDIQQIVQFARKNNLSVIPRAAGTSLAGQVVGDGLVVDCSKYLNQIIEINQSESWVKVQPGVVLDELNYALEPFGLFFGPETSTSTHCTVGGMFGNNSCGTHSIIYGSVRQHILEAEVVLANGDLATFGKTSKSDFLTTDETEQQRIQTDLHRLLKHPNIRKKVVEKFPPKSVVRRNTGYALDYLVETSVFEEDAREINLCELLAGSEGTLAFTTEMKLNCVPLPPKYKAVVCVQHHTIAQSCEANLIAIAHKPDAVELMDDIILKLARKNPIQLKQSQFIKGLPKAVLLVEFTAHTQAKLDHKIEDFLKEIETSGLSHHEVILYGKEVAKVWKLRKAGLGILFNIVGDRKPVALIEDTAVDPQVLPAYIAEFEELMTKYDNECVFYAHISVGELHLRPILNLKDKKDRELFRTIGRESAELVTKYRGSISGEHGDGRLRGEFIPIQYGEEMYGLFKQVKSIFDPENRFNPGKIVDTPPMDEFLRYEENQVTPTYDTIFDFSDQMGIVRAAEKCNGVGYCRKTEIIGGTMCPSFQATKNEKDATRARANTLREFLTNPKIENAFAAPEIQQALDLCLSCKACKTECPSGVDMAKLKAETLYQKYKTEGVPWRSKLIATNVEKIKLVRAFASLINPIMNLPFAKSVLGIAPQRNMPKIMPTGLEKWHQKQSFAKQENAKQVYLFNDEFTDTYDVKIGQKAVQLLRALGYAVTLITQNSGRSYFSKGLLVEARNLAKKNITALKDKITAEVPLVGIEPSTILTFRDEYPDLFRGNEKEIAQKLAQNTFTIEEFLANEIAQGRVTAESFNSVAGKIYVHGHCQQKSLVGVQPSVNCLQIIPNAEVEVIQSGCCGMAGSFGYEKEHYDVSMKIGELVLFPAVRNAEPNSIIVASGTSCRHQIADGTGKSAQHIVEVLYQQLKTY